MLVTLHKLTDAARRFQWALGAFNTYNLEITAAIVRAAESCGAPVIIQTGSGALHDEAGVALPALALALARDAKVPVAVHLDHCAGLAGIERALQAGYTSVMIDGSALSFEENIELTREVVRRAHPEGVTVEAELAGIAGAEDRAGTASTSSAFTDPDTAARFVAATGVDLLAVSIGNVHGFYRGEPRLDLSLLDRLRGAVPVPLVLHGASGLADHTIREAIARGVVKINFNTELRAALFTATEEALPEAKKGLDIPLLMRRQIAAVEEVVQEKLRLLDAAAQVELPAKADV